MSSSLETLSRDECLDRLRTGRIARIAVTHRALPAIVPVNYRLAGSTLVFRTEAGGMLAEACAGTVVAVSIDELAPDGTHGWDVLVVGVARLIEGSAALRAAQTGLASAAGDDRSQFVAVTIGRLSGRAVRPAAPAVSAAS